MATPKKKTKLEAQTEGQAHATRDGLLAGIGKCCADAISRLEDAEQRAARAMHPDLAAEARAILSTIRELWKDADKIIRPGAYQPKEEEGGLL